MFEKLSLKYLYSKFALISRFKNLGYNDPTAATWAPDNAMNIYSYAIKQANLPL